VIPALAAKYTNMSAGCVKREFDAVTLLNLRSLTNGVSLAAYVGEGPDPGKVVAFFEGE